MNRQLRDLERRSNLLDLIGELMLTGGILGTALFAGLWVLTQAVR